MKKKKNINIKFLQLKKSFGDKNKNNYIEENFKSGDLEKIFDQIQSLNLSLSVMPSRYSDDLDQKCIAFPGEIKSIPIPHFEGFITGIFFKRRSSDYPYDDDGEGMLHHLNLSDNNAIAETTFFMLDKERDLLLWVSNKYVSGFLGFAEYLTAKYISTCKRTEEDRENSHFSPLLIKDKVARIDTEIIINKEAADEFENDMQEIKLLDLKVAGTMSTLESMINPTNDPANIKGLLKIGKEIGGHSIEIKVTANKESVLDKSRIKTIYKMFKTVLRESTQKMAVRGTIDEETRVIDLFNDKMNFHTTIDYELQYVSPLKIFDELLKAHKYYLQKKG